MFYVQFQVNIGYYHNIVLFTHCWKGLGKIKDKIFYVHEFTSPGRHNDAWKILSDLEEALPGMVMVAMRRISLERRIGNREKTEILFQEYIEKATDLNVRAFYVIKYARYLFKVRLVNCFELIRIFVFLSLMLLK